MRFPCPLNPPVYSLIPKSNPLQPPPFRKLAGRTFFITGASRGIGKAIALKVARDGANVVVAAKTAEPHPKLPGTIYTAAKESEYPKLLFFSSK